MNDEGEKSIAWSFYGADQIEAERLTRSTWGDKSFESIHERCMRVHEEAVEVAQAGGCSREDVHKVVNMVFDKPVGDLPQEIAGVAFTLLALCANKGLRLDEVFATEIARFKSKDPKVFRDKKLQKAALGVSIRPE